MAVARDTHSESHTGAVGSISEPSFSWSHAGAASGVDGVLVSVHGLVTANDDALSVDYGGINVPAVTGGFAVDTATEPMSCKTFFYGGTDIPQGTQTVTVTRNNNTNELWAEAITVLCSTADRVGAVHEAGIVLQEGDGTLTGQSVTDGSPGTDSLRFAFISSGLAGSPSAHASSTLLGTFDTGNQTTSTVVETTGGQGARTVGFASGTSDDRAAVYLAIKEVVAVTVTTITPAALTHSRTLYASPGMQVNPQLRLAFLTHARMLHAPEFAAAPLTPERLTHTRALHDVQVNSTVKPAALAHTRTIFSPTVSAQTLLLPDLLTHSRTLFEPKVNAQLRPAILTHSRALYDPTAVPTLKPTALTHARAVFAPNVVHVVTPAMLTHARALPEPQTNVVFTVPTLTHARAVHEPILPAETPAGFDRDARNFFISSR